jgi:polysaccharide export outer membrane protein
MLHFILGHVTEVAKLYKKTKSSVMVGYKSLLFPLVFLVLFSACNRKINPLDSIIYFQEKGDTLAAKTIQEFEPQIKVGDRISIVVSALNPLSAAPYNLSNVGPTATATGYLVNNDSTITLPQLGRKKVAGLTRTMLTDQLTDTLKNYLTDPIVSINFLNQKVTVLGEVRRPGTMNLADNKITIIEAIGYAGDVTTAANRSNLLVIRESNGKREFGKVSLLSKELFKSPYFYLQQNDVVYVEPRKATTDSDQTYLRTLSVVATTLSVVTSLTFLILNLSRRF